MNVTAREFIKEQIEGLEAALKVAERVEIESSLYKDKDELSREVCDIATKQIEDLHTMISKLHGLLEKSKK